MHKSMLPCLKNVIHPGLLHTMEFQVLVIVEILIDSYDFKTVFYDVIKIWVWTENLKAFSQNQFFQIGVQHN